MGEKIVELRNELSEVQRLSEEIEDFGTQYALSPEVVFQLNLALEEAVTNVISYGFDDGRPHLLTVRLALEDGLLRAQVEDDGVAHDPLQTPPPDLDASLEERKVGGLGIHLVKELMDEVSYLRSDERNILTMNKHVLAE